jgi:hypothetical protein
MAITRIKCPGCGNIMGQLAVFCSTCGTKLDNPGPLAGKKDPDSYRDPCRDHDLAAGLGARFCMKCGKQISDRPLPS